MKRLTFVLPLKDRSHYTKIWLAHNVRQEYDYLIADGSIGNENEDLFREVRLPNVTYVRFPQDLSIERYVEKMIQAVDRVKTAYVMTCDNDDFINFQGIVSCIDALEMNPDAVCAGGPIYGVSQVEGAVSEPRYGMPVRIIDAAALSGLSGFAALVQLFESYKYLWYSVFRTPAYVSIWSDIRRLQISDVYLMEILQAELAFCRGKYVQTPFNHYIRLGNPTASVAMTKASTDMRHTRKIFFDRDYRAEAIKMSEHVANQLGIDVQAVLNEFSNYYISANGQNDDSIVSRMSSRIGRLHEIIPRRLNISFPIEFGIGFVNVLAKVRGGFGK